MILLNKRPRLGLCNKAVSNENDAIFDVLNDVLDLSDTQIDLLS